MAISILGHLEPADFYRAILKTDCDGLSHMQHRQKKKPKKLILGIKGKLPEHYPTAQQFSVPLTGPATL